MLASVPLAAIICMLWVLPFHQTLPNPKVRVSTSSRHNASLLVLVLMSVLVLMMFGLEVQQLAMM